MRTYATKTIRQLLRDNPDGLDVGTIANYVDREPHSVRGRLKEMPDAYIDRWEKRSGGGYVSIWCVVIPPDDCPHPTREVVAVRSSRRQAAGQTSQATSTQQP